MATNHTETAGGGFPEDPEDLLPEESVLSLEEYLAMHAAVGHRTRYEILYRLVHGGDVVGPEFLEQPLHQRRPVGLELRCAEERG